MINIILFFILCQTVERRKFLARATIAISPTRHSSQLPPGMVYKDIYTNKYNFVPAIYF